MTRGKQEPDEEELEKTLSRRDAAEYAGVHYNTIRLWEGRGLVHAFRVKVGAQEEVRIPVADLDKIVAERDADAPEPLLRPVGVTGNIEATRLWRAYAQTRTDLETANRRLEHLETEVTSLRRQLETSETERLRLLDAVLTRDDRSR